MDQLHDKERASSLCGAGVVDLGDVLVIHHGQGLALGLEAGDDLGTVHARLDDLNGDAAVNRLVLFGHVDYAKAGLADLLQKLVGADTGAGTIARSTVEYGRHGLEGSMPSRFL